MDRFCFVLKLCNVLKKHKCSEIPLKPKCFVFFHHGLLLTPWQVPASVARAVAVTSVIGQPGLPAGQGG